MYWKKSKFRILAITIAFAGSAYGKTITVIQKDKKFSKADLTIKVGDKVVFSNEDNTAHNIFSTTEGQSFNLGIQKAGASNEKVFATPTPDDKPVEVRCAIHPNMKITVKVEADKK